MHTSFDLKKNQKQINFIVLNPSRYIEFSDELARKHDMPKTRQPSYHLTE